VALYLVQYHNKLPLFVMICTSLPFILSVMNFA